MYSIRGERLRRVGLMQVKEKSHNRKKKNVLPGQPGNHNCRVARGNEGPLAIEKGSRVKKRENYEERGGRIRGSINGEMVGSSRKARRSKNAFAQRLLQRVRKSGKKYVCLRGGKKMGGSTVKKKKTQGEPISTSHGWGYCGEKGGHRSIRRLKNTS